MVQQQDLSEETAQFMVENFQVKTKDYKVTTKICKKEKIIKNKTNNKKLNKSRILFMN